MVQGLLIRRPDKSIPVDPEVAAWIDRTPYWELVGSLNYIAVATRPDISFAVGHLASVLDCYQLLRSWLCTINFFFLVT